MQLLRPGQQQQQQQSQRTWNSAAKVASTREERMTSRKAPRVPAVGGKADGRLHAWFSHSATSWQMQCLLEEQDALPPSPGLTHQQGSTQRCAP